MTTHTIFVADKTNLQNNNDNDNQLPNESSILSPPIENLIKKYQSDLDQLKHKEISPISVDEIASKLAKFYERVRKVVDWKEENVLRRSAILRILKRSLIHKISIINFAPGFDINQASESLVLELIRGGHLPNDEISTTKITEVANALTKYIYILEHAPFEENSKKHNKLLIKEKVNFYNWFLEIAAAEIEEILAPPIKEDALIKGMTLAMNQRIRILPKDPYTDEQKKTLTYIAVCRTLFDLDDSIIAYNVIKHHYPRWNLNNKQYLQYFANHIFSIKEGINTALGHSLSRQFFNICERTDTVFTLIGDILEKYKNNPEDLNQVFAEKEKFITLIREFYEKRYKTLKTRLFRMAIFSTMSVIVANIITYFEVELPLSMLVHERFTLFATIIDFFIPSIFMFLLVILIRPPSASNLDKVINLTLKFTYKNENLDIYEVKLKKSRRPLTQIIISSIYTSSCLLMFWVIGWVFYWAGIPMTSVILDTATIGLNIFAALVIRNKSRELTVSEKSTFWEFLIDIFSTPVAEVGSFFAAKWREYNIISVFLNFFLETPLVSFVEFIEDWRQFLKDKKADIH